MSNEIATYSMILSKLSLGKSGTECPTKTQILAINSLIVIDNASTYGANECVKIDDIRKKAQTWNYYLTVSPTSMSFPASGGSKQFTYSSYKRKVLDGVEQSGDISVSLKTSSASGTGFSISGTTVSASANQTASNRTGKITLTQNESNKTATINLSQSADSISSYGEWVITVSANPTSVSSSGGTSTITASAKRTVHWASGKVTEETGNPTLSTNLGSLSSSSSPSTLTLGQNTSTSSRTATIKATHGGKSATCTVTQAAKPVTYNIVFTYELNDVVQQTLTWDIPTTSTTKMFSVPTPSGGWSSSDKISLSLQPSSPGIGWTGRTHELNNAPMKDTTDTLSIENKSSGITFNVVYSIEGAAVFTFADGSTFKKQYSISQGDTHTYKTGIQPIISTVFGEEAGYNIGSHTVGIEVKTSTDNSVSVIVSKNTTGQPRTLYQEWNQWKSGNTGKTIRFEVDQAA